MAGGFPALPPSPDGGPRRPPQHISKAAAPRIPADQLPNHVAIVMDGNGRWATQRGLPRTEGHKMGEAVVIDIVCGAIEIGIKWLSLYAFSTENWKRSRRGSPLPDGVQPRRGATAPGEPQRRWG